jgi:thiamine pyrophosphate-dependent acetolactate synthase large subunit-like protein
VIVAKLRLPRDARRARRRASDDRQGRADDETLGRQTADAQSPRTNLVVVDRRPSPRGSAQGSGRWLNAGTRIAILAGQGAPGARDEFTRLADTFAAPVAKALLCKAVLPDDSPFTTDGIGDLGTAPSSRRGSRICDHHTIVFTVVFC